MIRRGFWLTVGAAGGIMGYRRVSALSRQVSETFGRQHGGHGGHAGQVTARRKRHWARETLRFTRDVREGMDAYIARQQSQSAPTLGPSTSTSGKSTNGKSNSFRNDHDKREDH
jgi:hypothetical protein